MTRAWRIRVRIYRTAVFRWWVVFRLCRLYGTTRVIEATINEGVPRT
jgi:hypothetical protein